MTATHLELALRVMTFNIRVDTPLDVGTGHEWRDRRESVVALVSRYSPDVIGIQEALENQSKDLRKALRSYRAVGKGRELEQLGESVPIFFRHERFRALRHGDYWLSSTPDQVGSVGWDAGAPRICTWAVLEDLATRRRLALVNTHLDVTGVTARLESALLVVDKLIELKGLPTVVTGDFNADPDSDIVKVFKEAGLVDCLALADPAESRAGTVHHYTGDLTGARKDYILCDAGWRIEEVRVLRDKVEGRYPSDHFPIICDLGLLSRRPG